jgi:hypothetical protein
MPTPPPAHLPWTRTMMNFGHRRIARMRFAKPMKNCRPASAVSIFLNSSNEAPAQNGPVPSLRRTIS